MTKYQIDYYAGTKPNGRKCWLFAGYADGHSPSDAKGKFIASDPANRVYENMRLRATRKAEAAQ